MAKYTIEDTTLTAIGDAVRSKTGKTELIPVTSLAAEIESIETGGGGGGTGGDEWIGDGNTHIWISLPEGRTSPMLGVCPKGTVTVDWGDGTTPDVLTGTNTTSVKYTPNHEYAKGGDYVITLTADGTLGVGGNNSTPYILRYVSGKDSLNYTYASYIKKIELGNSVTSTGISAFQSCYALEAINIPNSVTSIGQYMFNSCYALKTVNIPNSVTSIGAYAFTSCYALKSVNIPNSVTSIGVNAFGYCYALESVNIPNGVTSIETRVFSSCYALKTVNVPNSVTSIGTYAFDYCYCALYFDFTNHTAVPTLSDSNAFYKSPSALEFRVPAALYDEWIAATNWTTYASNIVAV